MSSREDQIATREEGKEGSPREHILTQLPHKRHDRAVHPISDTNVYEVLRAWDRPDLSWILGHMPEQIRSYLRLLTRQAVSNNVFTTGSLKSRRQTAP